MNAFDPTTGDFTKVNLAAQKKTGRWTILFFYPADFTFVCATEFEALADHQDHFKKLGADIVTVSSDTQYTHLAWQAHEKELANVKYLMASDTTGDVGRMFGVYDETSGLTLRGTFLISPHGHADGLRGQLLQRRPQRRGAAAQVQGEPLPLEEADRGLPGQVEGRRRQDADARRPHGGQGPRGPARRSSRTSSRPAALGSPSALRHASRASARAAQSA